MKETSRPETALSVTVIFCVEVPESPSVTEAELFIEIEGVASSSVIVNVPLASEMVAPDSLLNVIVAVSFASSRLSSATVTVIVLEESPAEKVSVPEVAV